jgi:hypothetical protein
MGMDVHGLKPKNPKGEYFRNNCWWWRPLWTYSQQVCPKITSKVKYGQSNDGDGLKTQKDCDILAKSLRDAVKANTPYISPPELSKVDRQGVMYPFSFENVLEFCDFLENCGGFSID